MLPRFVAATILSTIIIRPDASLLTRLWPVAVGSTVFDHASQAMGDAATHGKLLHVSHAVNILHRERWWQALSTRCIPHSSHTHSDNGKICPS